MPEAWGQSKMHRDGLSVICVSGGSGGHFAGLLKNHILRVFIEIAGFWSKFLSKIERAWVRIPQLSPCYRLKDEVRIKVKQSLHVRRTRFIYTNE